MPPVLPPPCLDGDVATPLCQVKALKSHPDVANMVARKKVLIVGAYYSFNGCVTFFGEGASTGSEVSCG